MFCSRLLRATRATGARTAKRTVAALRGAVATVATTLRTAFAFAMVSTGARILIALEIFGGAGRSLLRVVEARELTAVQVLTDDALEATEVTQVFAGNKGDGSARGERATRTANAVHVVFNLVREVEVHDVTDAVNVDAARSTGGRDEDADFAVLESLQWTRTMFMASSFKRWCSITCLRAPGHSKSS